MTMANSLATLQGMQKMVSYIAMAITHIIIYATDLSIFITVYFQSSFYFKNWVCAIIIYEHKLADAIIQRSAYCETLFFDDKVSRLKMRRYSDLVI